MCVFVCVCVRTRACVYVSPKTHFLLLDSLKPCLNILLGEIITFDEC